MGRLERRMVLITEGFNVRLKNFFENRASSTKDLPQRLVLRRENDRTRFILFYCVAGFILIFGQSAWSAEICAKTISEMKTLPSDALKKIAAQFETKNGFTNKTNRSHIKFKSPDGPAGRILVSFYSTSDSDGTLEFEEGALTICDDDGAVSINSIPSGRRDVAFTDDCFRIKGALASLVADRTTFCSGEMPVSVRAVLNLKISTDRAVAAGAPTSTTNSGTQAAAGVVR